MSRLSHLLTEPPTERSAHRIRLLKPFQLFTLFGLLCYLLLWWVEGAEVDEMGGLLLV